MFADGRNSLRLYHVSRSAVLLSEPHVSAVLCQVNFTTTQAGLTEQVHHHLSFKRRLLERQFNIFLFICIEDKCVTNWLLK